MKVDRYKVREICVCRFRCFGVGWSFYPQVDVLFHAVYVHLFLSYLSGSLEVKDEGN